LLTIPLVPIMSSCEDDFLEAKPELTVLEGANFDTPELALAQVNGLYASLKHGRFLGGRYQIYNDIRAEEFLNRTSNNVTGYSIWNQTGGADEPYLTDIWARGYLTINRANTFLAGLEENADKLDPEDVANFRAEAKFIRAISYFSLVQMFAKPYTADNGASPGLPLRLQPEFNSDNNSLSRSTVAQVYTQILQDLNDAEAELPETYSSRELATTRAHKNTAIALKTRVYLVMGRYADVITEGNKIVSQEAPFKTTSGVAYNLEDNVADVFENDVNEEVILAAPFAATDAPGTQNQLGYYYTWAGTGNLEYPLNTEAPGILANPQWEEDDARRTELTDVDSKVGTYTLKYSGDSPFIDWAPLIRYAEVLLNLAEAEAEVGDQARAIALLEAVHQRSDAAWAYTGSTQQELIDAILTERRIELLAEGFRTNDLFRRGLPILSRGAGSPTAPAMIEPSDSRYVLPIPTSETNTNPGL